MERGKINNPKRKQQILSFEDLRFGNITPTDIDGVIEYKNKKYIFFEVKYGKAKLPSGQKLAIERLVKDINENKKAIAIILEHNIHNPNNVVNVSTCLVRELYNGKIWRPPKYNIKLKELINKFIQN